MKHILCILSISFLLSFSGVMLGKSSNQLPPPNTPETNYKTCVTSDCHSDRKTKRYVHGPVASDKCFECHKPIMGKHEYKLLEFSARMCVDCHSKYFVETRLEGEIFRNRTDGLVTHVYDITVNRDLLLEKYDNKLTCLTCHDPHESDNPMFLKDMAKGESLSNMCLKCHQDILDRKNIKAHPIYKDLQKAALKNTHTKKDAPPDCIRCHHIHRSKDHPLLTHEANKLCIECHSKKLLKGKNHMMVKKGKQYQFGCLNCHSLHAGIQDSPQLKKSQSKPNICIDCHKSQHTLVQTKHDISTWSKERRRMILESRKLENVELSCQVCHAMHHSDHKTNHLGKPASLYSHDPISNQCLSCHKNESLKDDVTQIAHYSHPQKIVSATFKKGLNPRKFSVRFFSPLGQQVKDERAVVGLGCGSCHNPHSWSKTSTSLSEKKRQGNLNNSFLIDNTRTMEYCSACHGEDTLVYYSLFHRDTFRRWLKSERE